MSGYVKSQLLFVYTAVLLWPSEGLQADPPLKIMVMGNSIHHATNTLVPTNTPRVVMGKYFKGLAQQFIGPYDNTEPNANIQSPDATTEIGHAVQNGASLLQYYARDSSHDASKRLIFAKNASGSQNFLAPVLASSPLYDDDLHFVYAVSASQIDTTTICRPIHPVICLAGRASSRISSR